MDGKCFARRLSAAALLVLLSGCSGGGGEAEQRSESQEEQPDDDDSRGAPGEDGSDSDDESPSSTDEESPPDADPDAETAVRQAYVDYQTMFERLVIEPDSDDPEIEQLTSGDELNHVVDVLTRYETRNQAVEFGTRQEHNVFDVQLHTNGRTAVVLDCNVSDARVVNASTRGVLSRDPEGGAANVVTATVVLSDDAWTVDATDAIPLQPGQGCGPDGVIRGS
ncbi:MAG TPA: hypothetical protein VK611_20100 [Acidimicrobiales bacterium]|nr:hypothetical protein [Acidimicrobiales bacterium]